MFKIAEAVAALKAVIAEIDHHGNPLLEELLATLKALVAEIAAEIAAEIGHNGGPPLDERLAALEAAVAEIGHNGGPPLDERLAALEAAVAEIGHNGGPPLDERLAALEAAVAEIGHNGGPPLDERLAALEAAVAEIGHNGGPPLDERLAALEAAVAEIGHNGGPPLDERLAALEAAVAEIGHNGGPPLDDEPTPPKRKAGLLPDKQVAQRYGVSVRTVERWDDNPDLNFPPPIYILRRRYRNIALLDAWDRANARRVADPRHLQGVALSLPRAQRGRFAKPDILDQGVIAASAEVARIATALRSESAGREVHITNEEPPHDLQPRSGSP